jgi:type IV pilus assembly protein PilC
VWKTLLTILFLVPALALVGGPYGFVIAMIAAGLLIRYSLTCRDGAALDVFTAIHAAIRQNLPLPTALTAEADGQTGPTAQALTDVSAWLSEGQPLGEALRRGFPQCPGYALGMVVAAERIRQVPRAVAMAQAWLADAMRAKRQVRPVNPMYPVAVMCVATLLIWGLSVFVMPKIRHIFDGMNADLPVATRMLIAGATPYLPLLLAVLVLCLLGGVPMVIYFGFRARRPGRPWTTSYAWDYLKWHLPVLHWFERTLSVAQTMGLLRLALDSGVPMDEAIAAASELDVNSCYRRRLTRWLERVQRGENVAEAARRSRVGRALAWAFDADAGSGHTPSVLESMEEVYRARYACVAAVARSIVWPVAILAIALLTGAVVYAVFAPLCQIVEVSVEGVLP